MDFDDGTQDPKDGQDGQMMIKNQRINMGKSISI